MAVSEARIPSLCSRRSSFRPGLSRSTTNDLIAPRPGAAIERRPDDDQLGPVARGDEDLLAVEDVLVVSSSRLAVARIAAESEPASGSVIAIAAQRPPKRSSCSGVGDRGDRRLAETLAGHRQQQADVAPAHLDDAEHDGHVARRCGCRSRRSFARAAEASALAASRAGRAGAAERAACRPCRRAARRACRAPWDRCARRGRTCGSWRGTRRSAAWLAWVTRALNFLGISRLIIRAPALLPSDPRRADRDTSAPPGAPWCTRGRPAAGRRRIRSASRARRRGCAPAATSRANGRPWSTRAAAR